MIGELLGGLRSLEQVFQQIASAHTTHEEFAFTDDGEHWPGVEKAFAAANALKRAALLVSRAERAVDQASGHSGRIAWNAKPFRPAPPVGQLLAPRLGPGDPFARPDRTGAEPRGLAL